MLPDDFLDFSKVSLCQVGQKFSKFFEEVHASVA